MRIRQFVFAARELEPASATLAALLGLDAPFRDPAVASFGLNNVVHVFGDQFIEVVSPMREGTAAGRLLQRRGDGGYMLILQTDDLVRDHARFGALGVRTVFEAELPDIRAVHLHPKDVGGAIVSLDEPRPAASWRWGGPDWRVQAGRRGAQRIVGVSVEADDPRAMALRWSAVLGLSAPSATGPGWRLSLEGGEVGFVRAGSRGEGIAGCALAVSDLHAVLASARTMGLPVQGDSVSFAGTRVELRALA